MHEVSEIGDLLRGVRAAAGLAQRDWSERSGVAQSSIAAFEKGSRMPSIPTLVRLLDAVDLRLIVGTGPVWELVDRVLLERRDESMEDRSAHLPWFPWFFFDGLKAVDWVIAGTAAAVLQGVPVPAQEIELLVPDDDDTVEALSIGIWRYVQGFDAVAWLGDGRLPTPEELRKGSVTRWKGLMGHVLIRLVPRADLAPATVIEVEDHKVRVVPLLRLELADPEAARLMARARELYTAQDAARAAAKAS